ncbi:MAG: hypothetical protein LBB53_03915 [Prevotellaceae bacterium]|nr:hypothetical protein [Prevotellaceae bacterium]
MEKYKKEIRKEAYKKLKIKKNIPLDIVVFFDVLPKVDFSQQNHSVEYFLGNFWENYTFRTFAYNDSLGIYSEWLDKTCCSIFDKQNNNKALWVVNKIEYWNDNLQLFDFLKENSPEYIFKSASFFPKKSSINCFYVKDNNVYVAFLDEMKKCIISKNILEVNDWRWFNIGAEIYK